jgi:hypothetical protein
MSAKESIFGALLAVVIIIPAIYFGLPYFSPDVKSLNENIQDLESLNEDIQDLDGLPRGIILQSIYNETYSIFQIMDYQITLRTVTDSAINITISENSRIYVEFNTPYILGLDASLNHRLSFEISILIEDVANRTSRISYYRTTSAASIIELSGQLTLNLQTKPLPANTYSVGVFVKCLNDVPGANYLLFNTPPFNYTRSILVQELL